MLLSLCLLPIVALAKFLKMVLHLHLFFFTLLAALILPCVIFAKLREITEAGRGSISRPLEDDKANVVTPRTPGHRQCKRRVRFNADSGLFGEHAQESAENRNNGLEDEAGMQKKEAEARFWIEESRISSGWIDEKEEDDCDDDWERLYKTDLHLTFDRAVRYIGSLKSSDLDSKISREEKTKMNVLHKFATEGPCPELRRQPFRVSMQWFSTNPNAGQGLGNMSPEDAMQQYIGLVSSICPGWMQNDRSARSPTLTLPRFQLPIVTGGSFSSCKDHQ